MDVLSETTLQEKVEAIYERLKDETENRDTIHDRTKNAILHAMLMVFEHLVNHEADPMDEIFY